VRIKPCTISYQQRHAVLGGLSQWYRMALTISGNGQLDSATSTEKSETNHHVQDCSGASGSAVFTSYTSRLSY